MTSQRVDRRSADPHVQKREAVNGPGGRVLLIDSITQLEPRDAGALVVAASHGGTSSATFALAVPLRVVVFNDAGVGKDAAGIAALPLLAAAGIAAAAVAHTSARIGDAEDMWASGIVSHANSAARALGLVPGVRLHDALTRLVFG